MAKTLEMFLHTLLLWFCWNQWRTRFVTVPPISIGETNMFQIFINFCWTPMPAIRVCVCYTSLPQNAIEFKRQFALSILVWTITCCKTLTVRQISWGYYKGLMGLFSISFSSYEQPIWISNFYSNVFVCLLFEVFYKVKVPIEIFNSISKRDQARWQFSRIHDIDFFSLFLHK